jgi:hypothetical protein
MHSGKRAVEAGMIEVHHFKVLDEATGKWVVPLYKCSEARIAELKGHVIGNTMQIVARASLDKDGCYQPEKRETKQA